MSFEKLDWTRHKTFQEEIQYDCFQVRKIEIQISCNQPLSEFWLRSDPALLPAGFYYFLSRELMGFISEPEQIGVTEDCGDELGQVSPGHQVQEDLPGSLPLRGVLLDELCQEGPDQAQADETAGLLQPGPVVEPLPHLAPRDLRRGRVLRLPQVGETASARPQPAGDEDDRDGDVEFETLRGDSSSGDGQQPVRRHTGHPGLL